MAVNAVTAREIHQFELEADETTCRDVSLNGGATVVGGHVLDASFALGDALHDRAEIIIRHVQIKGLVGLTSDIVDALGDDHWAGDKNFKTFAAHLLHEDGDLHGSTGADVKDTGGVCVLE